MSPQDFCYWLQGLLEVGRPASLDSHQIQQIKDHLDLVFEKKTPDRNPLLDNLKLCAKSGPFC